MQAKQVLHKLLDTTCSMMHQTRRTALEVNVMAALTGTRWVWGRTMLTG